MPVCTWVCALSFGRCRMSKFWLLVYFDFLGSLRRSEIKTLYVDPRLKHMIPTLYPQGNLENYVSVKAKGRALIKEDIVKMVEFDRAEETEHLIQQPARAPAAPAAAAPASPASPAAAQPARLSLTLAVALCRSQRAT